ncbi:hypothetical protein ACFFU1_06230 [Algibacter miyuki]|uniref:DUF4834 domain-containing protein n=1 Tax=Algibacter miyuki TaxID=1306933 RepID=A0ABV5GYE6_9FLAO|nr:hypothetical protein [Algibacter miyuki]MDN3667317.1 hypothetical protein [Algibacter miyuki]
MIKTHFLHQKATVFTLIVVLIFFGVLLCLGVRKSHKLKKENKRLEALNTASSEDDDDKPYKDFRQGHLYDNK